MAQESADWLCVGENMVGTRGKWLRLHAWFGLASQPKTADRNAILPAVVVGMIGWMMSYVTDILNIFVIFTLVPEK
jgi:hypothetical protein